MSVKKRWILVSSISVVGVIVIVVGVVLGLFYNPNLNFKLGLPFQTKDIDKYILVLDAHDDKGGPAGAGGAQNDNDAIHIMPKENSEYITVYAPIAGKITVIKYGTILNQIGKPKNYCVGVTLNIGLGLDVHFNIENYSNDPNVEALQKELMHVKKGKRVKPGDPLFTFVSAGIGAHVRYSIFTTKGRYHPYDFMTEDNIAICNTISGEKPRG